MASDLMSNGTESRAERAAGLLAKLARDAGAGARLGTKAQLRERCGVSVGTFNEALRLAQARGMVVVRPGPGGGLFAAEQSPMVRLGNSALALDASSADAASVADAIRIRDTLDPLLIRDAVWHSSAADITRYREQVAAMAAAGAAGDANGFMRANWRLHELLAEVNPSPMLRTIYIALLDAIRSRALDALAAEGHTLAELFDSRHRVHAELVEAIAERDQELLEKVIAEHSVEDANDYEHTRAGRGGPGRRGERTSMS